MLPHCPTFAAMIANMNSARHGAGARRSGSLCGQGAPNSVAGLQLQGHGTTRRAAKGTVSLNSYDHQTAGAWELAEPSKQHQDQGIVTTGATQRTLAPMHVGRCTRTPQQPHTDDAPAQQQPQTDDGTHAPQQAHTDHHPGQGMAVKRRDLLLCLSSLALSAGSWVQPAQAAAAQPLSPVALAAFRAALNTSGSTFEEQDAAWSRVIALAPDNSIAWSNRGALRLQYTRWSDAEADLSHSLALEAGVQDASGLDEAALLRVDPSTLNNLGNSEVALGKLSEAQLHFQAASNDRTLRTIALANLALAAFEGLDDQLAIRVARQILRRDPAFLDARCALVAFLYGSGQVAEAEGQFDALQNADDGVGAQLYNRKVAVARVQDRWPPRATAALDAFLSLSPSGTATGYDLQPHSFTFANV